jgi:hypothetical protein
MNRRRQALAKYVLPLGVVGLASAPALATSAPASFALGVSYNLGAGFASPGGFAVQDLNGDSHLDVAIGSSNSNAFSVFPGVGNGTLSTATTVSTSNAAAPGAAYRPRTVATGDLNNDGRVDLYFAGYGANDNIASLNQSSGGVLGFGTPTYISAVQAPGTPALGDLNKDGELDVVQPGYNGGNGDANTVLTRMGNGDGTFQASSQLFTNPLPGAGSRDAAIADVNGDGNLDVIAAVDAIGGSSPRQGAVMTALGNGDGTFQMPASVSLTGSNNNPATLVVSDINGDGDLDVLTGNNASVSTLLGDGTGAFATGTVNASLDGYSLAAADLNGDGFIDLATADWYGDSVNVVLGNGDGTFAPPSSIAMPTSSTPYGLALADMNGDGLNDIVVGTYAGGSPSGGTLSVMLNTSVAAALAAPTALVATPGNNSASIAFTAGANNGSPITNYEYSTNGGSTWTAFSPSQTTSPVTITGLTNGITYQVKLHAISGASTGAASSAVSVTPAIAPAGPNTEPATGTSPSNASDPTPLGAATPASTVPGRLTIRTRRTASGRTLISTGRSPAGATRVVQTATGEASSTAHAFFGAWATARAQTSCPISTTSGRSTFTCTLHLAPGRWTVTTKALSGSSLLARSTARLRVKAVARISVTG